MRVMMVNLGIVVLSAAFFAYTTGQGLGDSINGVQELKMDVLDIMQKHFDSSLDYLYTGVQYDSQYGERPGLAKKLRAKSDAEWEAGMEALNKFLEHGGSTDQGFVGKLHFQGGETAKLGSNSKGQTYASTLKKLSDDSETKLHTYNTIWNRAIGNDGDIAHYLEEKIEKEQKYSHELKGHITTFEAMKNIGPAVAAFDSNL